MDTAAHDTRSGQWTGELLLDLRNGRDWSIGEAELSIRRDTVVLRHQSRGLAIMDRELFADWLSHDDPSPLAVDDVVWRVQVGVTFMTVGHSWFRVVAESLSTLVAVI